MQVTMLGPVEVRDDAGCVVEISGARLRALLVLLALRPRQVVPAAYLIDELWESRAPDGAANALQSLVSRLRRTLPDGVVASRPGGYQLALDRDRIDVFRFERLAARGRALLSGDGDPTGAALALREALALWRGPALADAGESESVRAALVRLDELRLAATEDRIDADLRLGSPSPPLVAELEGLLAAYPLRETLSGLLMRALAASGRRGAALEVYERVRGRLADQLGADPSASLAALHLEILRAEETSGGGAGSAGGEPRTNLRAELTSFVGREADLARVGALLRGHRLVTLTGPGGAGKTRLAVEAARSALGMQPGGLSDAPPGGVWLAELAPVTDPTDVASMVLGAFGLREQALLYAVHPGRTMTGAVVGGMAGGQRGNELRGVDVDALDRLVAALATRRALLVLDNCEHLIAAAAVLADRVLAGCPGMRILATSREPLNITGETLWPVGPLELPPDRAAASDSQALPDSQAATADVHTYASVDLFEQRARAVSPGFEVTPANADAVHRICRALDGMPLAIELAAARMRSMAPDQIAARLDDRFRLLTGGSRTAVPRHQTLRAVVDWSWDLLDEAERALLRRLSVFTGGATLAAAEQVCADSQTDSQIGGQVERERMLDLLAALVDKSLLTVRHTQDGPRYRMLEIIRAYGRERLTEAGEGEELRQAHARYFRQLAEAGMDPLLGADQLDWMRKLADDQDNLHAALRGAIAARDAETAVAMVAALGWYWYLRSLKAEGAELSAAALALAEEQSPADERPGRVTDDERLAAAYGMAAMLTFDTPRRDAGVEWLRKSAGLAANLRVRHHPVVRLVGALTASFEVAGGFVPVALDAAVGDAVPWVSATARILRGQTALNIGQTVADAEADFRAAAGMFEALGERWGTAIASQSLATLEAWRGEFAAAAGHYELAMRLTAELGTTEDETQNRICLARELWLLGDIARAADELTRALRDAERLALPELEAFAAVTAGDLARLGGDADAARHLLSRAAVAAAKPGTAAQWQAAIALARGLIAGGEGDLDAERAYLAAAVDAALPTIDSPVIAQVLTGLADLAAREGDARRAATLLGASQGVRGATDRSVPDEERVAATVRGTLTSAEWDAAFQRGRGVTLATLEEVLTPDAGRPGPPVARTPG